ncbi:MAG TPA: hypothetical protein VEH52_09185 [Gaiellaceae bacterium]|nr:hypothetical protein [Gaiellaceae bacterium]
MAAWGAAAPAEQLPVTSRRARPRPEPRKRRRRREHQRITGGAVWIGVLAALLAGIVALNVAVLRLNMQLDDLARNRDNLRADNAALASQLSSAAAAGRIQNLAMKKFGFVPATSDQTSFVQLGR